MDKPVLVVEDDELQRMSVAQLLRRKLDFQSHMAENGQEALAILDQYAKTVRLVIMDVTMPVMGGLETLEIMAQRFPHIAVIMLTGSADIDHATKAMKLGATDYIHKPFDTERFLVTVRNALRISTLSKEVTRLRSEQSGTLTLGNLIGYDEGLASTVTLARKAAASDIPVLITGETGTGKEVFAKAIHGESTRTGQPFIAVNCGAIPAQLVESTLFGHEKGAFTGATERTVGKFREAEGGTIFLDEVGELPLDVQVKLLRVLQQKEVEPVGAGKPVPINVRILSATNRDLQKEVDAGRFREDLFFRLNVLQIELPALRRRKQDIPDLCHHFIERISSSEGKIPKQLSPALAQKLQSFDWPGNVRQLENAISRALVISEGNMLEVEDFNSLWSGESAAGPADSAGQTTIETQTRLNLLGPDGSFKSVDDIEQEVMQKALAYCDGNITQAADAIGMAKSTFYKKLKK